MKKGKVLVTGGAGYIGSHTIIELLAGGYEQLISADNFSNSHPSSFDRIRRISGRTVTNYNIDLCDLDAVKKIFRDERGIDSVIHFAAFKSVPDSVADPERYYHNNNMSLQNLLHCCRENGVKNFIFSSSCSVYGNITTLPVDENTRLNKPESPYAETKRKGEQLVEDFAREQGSAKTVILRYFNPAGAHPSGLTGEVQDRPQNLVPVITATAIGKLKETVVYGNDYATRDGSCIRDYVHVCDIARAHVLALDHLINYSGKQKHFLYNLGTGKGVSVLEAIHAFEKVSGKKLHYRVGPRREGDVEAIYSDSSRAEKELGWKPNYSIEDMMASAWKWELHNA